MSLFLFHINSNIYIFLQPPGGPLDASGRFFAFGGRQKWAKNGKTGQSWVARGQLWGQKTDVADLFWYFFRFDFFLVSEFFFFWTLGWGLVSAGGRGSAEPPLGVVPPPYRVVCYGQAPPTGLSEKTVQKPGCGAAAVLRDSLRPSCSPAMLSLEAPPK